MNSLNNKTNIDSKINVINSDKSLNKKYKLIDTHCHLNYPGLVENIDHVIQRAKENGVEKMVCISTNLDQVEKMLKIIKPYKNVAFTIGQHPCETMCKEKDRCGIESATQIYEIIDKMIEQHIIKQNTHKDISKLVGIGETGLDIYNKNLHSQIDIFHAHLELGIKYDLPVVVHSREMDEQLLLSLKQHPNAKGVLHCWTGSYETAKKAIDLGWKISFSGILTFGKKAQHLEEQAKELPLESIVIETDAPFLAPAPYRGKTNEPAFVLKVAEKISELRCINMEKLCEQLYKNSCNLFNI